MSVQENLEKILNSTYGKDVRQAIHDSIEDCYDDATGNPASISAAVAKVDAFADSVGGKLNRLEMYPDYSTREFICVVSDEAFGIGEVALKTFTAGYDGFIIGDVMVLSGSENTSNMGVKFRINNKDALLLEMNYPEQRIYYTPIIPVKKGDVIDYMFYNNNTSLTYHLSYKVSMYKSRYVGSADLEDEDLIDQVNRIDSSVTSHGTSISTINAKITELESGSSGGSGVTSTMASTLWAIIQKCAFATALTDTEKNAFKTAWGITDSSSSSGGSSSGGSTDTPSTPTSYSVTKNLTNCSISNSSTTVTAGSSYTATITANTNCELGTVTVTMGGVSQTVTNGVVNITSVTGDIVINATATSTNVFKTEYEEYKDSWLWVENQYVSADDGTLTDKTNLKTYKVTPPSWATHYLVMIARTSSDLNITGRMGCIYGDKYIMSSGQSVYGRTKTYDFESISADASNAYIQPIISGSSSIFFSVESNQTFSGIHWIKYPTLEDGSTPVENKLYLINYEYESGQLNGTTGSIAEHTYFGTTNYINVSDFDYVKMARAEQISWNYAFYDLSKAYVSGANGDFRTGSFDIPSGVTFGRFSARSTSAYKAIGSNYAYNALKPIYFAKSEVTE